jgi:uncharacterized protein YndB with AHSA1/START domain
MRRDDTPRSSPHDRHDDPDRDVHLDGEATEARFEQVVDLDASIEAAWDAISDPSELANWLGPVVELDLRPGGHGRVVDDDGAVRQLVITDVRAGEQVAWHWWSESGELSSVELRLDRHDGHTRLHITETTLLPSATPDVVRAQVHGCARRWSAATSRLWCRVGTAAFA